MSSNVNLSFRIDSNYTWAAYGVRRAGATEYRDFPVRLSVPVAAGAFSAKDQLEIRDAKGAAVRGSVRPMHLWPDGSVRVWEAVMPANLKREESQTFTLGPARGAATKPTNQALHEPSKFTVTATLGDDTTVSRHVALSAPTADDGFGVHEDEHPFELKTREGVVAFKGAIIRKSWSWYPAVEIAVRAINYLPADESTVKALTLEFDVPGRGKSRYAIRHSVQTAEGIRLVESNNPFDVRADSGGIHVSDIAQVGRKQTDYAVYERGAYAEAVDAWIAMSDDANGWLLAVPEASERMPKGWHINGKRVTIELHPKWAEPLTWRRGMALYQRVCLSRMAKNTTPEAFENEAYRWLRQPITTVDSDVYRAAGWRIPFRYQPERFPKTEFTIRDTWAFGWSTGTFEWGDQLQGRMARNLEYDFPASCAKEYARTGHPELWKKVRASSEHMMHTDFVAVSDDEWKEGGVPAHCPRHTTGSAYPSHIWCEGLTLYYLLSGDKYALKVAERIADFFVKYIDERFQVIEATGREVGWALIALAAVYDLTRQERHLNGIKKCVDFYLKGGPKNFFPTDATFATGVGLIGLDRTRHFHRDAETKKFIVDVLDHMMATRMDGIGLFDYWFDSERQTFTYINSHLPEAINIGYHLTGNLKYLKVAWRLYQIHEGGACLTVQNRPLIPECGYAAGYHITWTMGCLASFAERGWLDKLQYADPE